MDEAAFGQVIAEHLELRRRNCGLSKRCRPVRLFESGRTTARRPSLVSLYLDVDLEVHPPPVVAGVVRERVIYIRWMELGSAENLTTRRTSEPEIEEEPIVR